LRGILHLLPTRRDSRAFNDAEVRPLPQLTSSFETSTLASLPIIDGRGFTVTALEHKRLLFRGANARNGSMAVLRHKLESTRAVFVASNTI
jgi:hypothetical protein